MIKMFSLMFDELFLLYFILSTWLPQKQKQNKTKKANFQEWKQLILTASNNTFNPTVNNNNE